MLLILALTTATVPANTVRDAERVWAQCLHANIESVALSTRSDADAVERLFARCGRSGERMKASLQLAYAQERPEADAGTVAAAVDRAISNTAPSLAGKMRAIRLTQALIRIPTDRVVWAPRIR